MLFAWKGRYCTKTEQGSGEKPREQGRRNPEKRRGCKEMLCVARPAPAKARRGHVVACAGSHERAGCSKQAHTSLASISQVPITRPEPRGSREKYGLFPLVSTPRFTAPHKSPPCKDRFCIDSFCLHPNRPKKRALLEGLDDSWIYDRISQHAGCQSAPAPLRLPHARTHRSRPGKPGPVQAGTRPVNQHLPMPIPCQPLRLRRRVRHHLCPAESSDQPANMNEYLPCVFNNVC